MPKTPDFKKRGISVSKELINEKLFWRVIIGKRFLGGGRNAIQKRFKTHADAVDFVRDEIKKKEGDPVEAKKLDNRISLRSIGSEPSHIQNLSHWRGKKEGKTFPIFRRALLLQ
jgi:hypothetical protein